MKTDPQDDARNDAKARSMGCDECSGTGVTSRYVDVRRPNGEVITASCGAICHRCAMGDFIRGSRDTSDDLTLRRLVDLRARPEYQPEQLKFPPETCEYLENNRGFMEPRQLPGGVVAAWKRRLEVKYGQRGVQTSAEASGTGDQGSGQGNDAGGPPVDCAGVQAA